MLLLVFSLGIFAFVIVCLVLALCLLNLTSPSFNNQVKSGERLQFLKNLSEAHDPIIRERWALSYIYEFTLNFPQIKVELEYNIIRKKWDILIWSIEAKEFLFYYDLLDRRPCDSINFILEKYNLVSLKDEAESLKTKKDKEKKLIVDEVKGRYLNNGTSRSD